MFHKVSYSWFQENPIYTTIWGVLQECREVSAEDTKYAEHIVSYGYSFRIYGDFEEILK